MPSEQYSAYTVVLFNHCIIVLSHLDFSRFFLILQTIAGYLNYVSLNAYTTIGLHEFVWWPFYKYIQKGRLAPPMGQDVPRVVSWPNYILC